MSIHDLTEKQVIGIQVFYLVVASSAVGVRLYTRLHILRSSITISDICLFFGYIFTVGWLVLMCLGLIYHGIEYDIGSIGANEPLLKVLFAAQVCFDCGLFAVKFSFLALYFTLVNEVFHKTRIALYFMTAFTISAAITTIVIDFAICVPFSEQFSTKPGACNTWSDLRPWNVSFGLHMLSDIMIFALPFAILRKMSLSKGSRWGLVATFSLGFITMTVTLIRFGIVSVDMDYRYNTVLCSMEMCCAVLVACLPICKHILAKHFRKLFATTIERTTMRRTMLEDGNTFDGGRLFSVNFTSPDTPATHCHGSFSLDNGPPRLSLCEFPKLSAF